MCMYSIYIHILIWLLIVIVSLLDLFLAMLLQFEISANNWQNQWLQFPFKHYKVGKDKYTNVHIMCNNYFIQLTYLDRKELLWNTMTWHAFFIPEIEKEERTQRSEGKEEEVEEESTGQCWPRNCSSPSRSASRSSCDGRCHDHGSRWIDTRCETIYISSYMFRR